MYSHVREFHSLYFVIPQARSGQVRSNQINIVCETGCRAINLQYPTTELCFIKIICPTSPVSNNLKSALIMNLLLFICVSVFMSFYILITSGRRDKNYEYAMLNKRLLTNIPAYFLITYFVLTRAFQQHLFSGNFNHARLPHDSFLIDGENV
jgi:hypothetical protein